MNDPLLPFPHCGRSECTCAHTECAAGWIESTVTANGRENPGALPCPACRADRLSDPSENADTSLGRARWQSRLRHANARAARNESDDDW